jgi:defect-in-organelle-trafficking protein DotC
MRGAHVLVALLILVMPVSVSAGKSEEPAPLKELLDRRGKADPLHNSTVAQLRPEAIREAAFVVGTQAGVKWRYAQIVDLLRSREHTLDTVFDFTPLLLNGGRVLPPVIVSAEQAFRVDSPVSATSSDATYTILIPARLISAPPNWRSYLLREDPVIDTVHAAVLPWDSDEREIWRTAVLSGWKQGLRHADRVFEAGLNRLARDYRGMLRFKLLAQQGMVSVPELNEGRLGICVQDALLEVDQRVFRLTDPGRFRPVEDWHPVIGGGR